MSWSLEQYLTGILFLIVIVSIYCYHNYLFNYWTRHRIIQIKPSPIVGNLLPILSLADSSAKVIERIFNDPLAKDQPVVGIYLFHQPALLIKDPELIKRILIRDFGKFNNRFANSNVELDPLGSQNLFLLKNPIWKEIRFKLTPFFTRGKIKQMFPLIEEIGFNLNNYLMKLSSASDCFELEVKEISALYTTDVIATVAFGLQANSFEDPNGHFRRNGRAIFHFDLRRAINFTTVFFLPHLVRLLRVKVVEDEQTEFLRSTINYVVAEREKSGKIRNDLIDILIEFKNHTKTKEGLNSGEVKFEGDLLVAQAAIFFTAGFESSSATMAFALYELARNPEVQTKLREEIYEMLQKNEGNLSLDAIDSLEYMQMIISETLRLYPPLPFLDRECTVEKGQRYSLEPFHSFEVPRGMPVYIPVYGLHMSEKYFPDPYAFKPERFSAENRKTITPYTYMPFGLGPHACIGERFAYLQTKVGLVQFLRNHWVTMGPKTLEQIRFEPKALILQSAGGIILNVKRDPLMI